jgi:hypothetical protein
LSAAFYLLHTVVGNGAKNDFIFHLSKGKAARNAPRFGIFAKSVLLTLAIGGNGVCCAMRPVKIRHVFKLTLQISSRKSVPFLNFDFHADPDPYLAYNSNADPDPASQGYGSANLVKSASRNLSRRGHSMSFMLEKISTEEEERN